MLKAESLFYKLFNLFELDNLRPSVLGKLALRGGHWRGWS
jgi:hypothetical protein